MIEHAAEELGEWELSTMTVAGGVLHEVVDYSNDPHEPKFIADCGFNDDSEAHARRIVADRKAAPTAPHECADPQCPGNVNRRKLEAYPDLVNGTHKTVVWLRRLAKQFDECAAEYREVADQLDIALAEAPGKERRVAAGT